ncbi:hypothetical protein ACFLUG_00235 [Chloroflexota bacterium]
MSVFNRFTGFFSSKMLNGGTALTVMGAAWLYLWVGPWYQAFLNAPHWGHNYIQAGAFLALGLAYFNRRVITDSLAFLATLLIIPSALELIPHPATAIAGAVILLLAILDIIVERKRSPDLWQSSNQRLAFWLKKHLPRFSYIMLAHLSFIYFLVRLPMGTYENELVTKVFDGMMIIQAVLLLLEDMPGIANVRFAKRAGFFWGMLTIIVSLVILANQPETLPLLGIAIVIMIAGIASVRAGQLPDGEAPASKETSG